MTSVSRIKASSRLVQKFKPTVPDKLKGGKLERLGDQKFKSLKFKVIYWKKVQNWTSICKDKTKEMIRNKHIHA
jgi:hypothetical protein